MPLLQSASVLYAAAGNGQAGSGKGPASGCKRSSPQPGADIRLAEAYASTATLQCRGKLMLQQPDITLVAAVLT
jgi:hypothetical protein